MPGSARNACLVSREASAVLLGHRLGAGMQIARARVIAEPGPGLQHVVERRRGQRLDASASAPGSARNTAPTAFTVVCCSMISESQTR